MTHYDNIWIFKTARFAVTLDCTEETDPDLSWSEDGEVLRQLEAGLLYNLCFRVRVTLDGGEVGADYLGNSVYADPAEFRDHFGCKPKGYSSYFTDMVREAIAQARKNVKPAPRLRTQ